MVEYRYLFMSISATFYSICVTKGTHSSLCSLVVHKKWDPCFFLPVNFIINFCVLSKTNYILVLKVYSKNLPGYVIHLGKEDKGAILVREIF